MLSIVAIYGNQKRLALEGGVRLLHPPLLCILQVPQDVVQELSPAEREDDIYHMS